MLLLLLLITKASCHTAVDENNVFIVGHNNEEDHKKPVFISNNFNNISEIGITTTTVTYNFSTYTTKIPGKPQENHDIVFVPNTMTEQAPSKNYYDDVRLRDRSFMSVKDVMTDTRTEYIAATEKPVGDIYFISGKNKEVEKTKSKIRRYNSKEVSLEGRGKEMTIKKSRPLRCNNLNCNVKEKPVCAAKMDRGDAKYRLFLNKCYFRMVNCEFRYEENRYIEAPIEKCSHIGRTKKLEEESLKQVFYLPPKIRRPPIVETEAPVGWINARRSMSQSIDGAFCGHTCPATCPDTYKPECALSSAGHHVFENHCRLDMHSCTFGVVWRRRALSECVGGRKADVQQNRGFIGWMQRVGIVDQKGRIVQ